MSTTVRVTVPASEHAEADAEAVFAVFRGVDARMSEWKESSPLAAVNHAAGDGPVPVPADLVGLLERSVEIARLTDGAFDPTWAALWGLWDFRAAEPTVPGAAEIERRAALVDYRRLEIDAAEGTVRLPEEGMQLGLGGIAKGYALDRAVETLRRRGVDSFLLVAGGQVYAVGRKHGGSGGQPDRPWRVGIRDPRGPADDFFAEIELTDASASTSGDYESFFIEGGVRYHHVLDPRSGRPARSGVTGATVVSADATLADALSTALVVMGEERGLALVERLDGAEALVVTTTGKWRATPALEQNLVLHHAPRTDQP
jgi:thiamine biosynthesis lipoprotein